ncbi:MAG: hypothetical protein F6K50_19315 [Moorea sp. SIO3I7]|nr:hypothetical protein [Moorena sp. SIO3I7]
MSSKIDKSLLNNTAALGSRESGVGSRESGVGSRESGAVRPVANLITGQAQALGVGSRE